MKLKAGVQIPEQLKPWLRLAGKIALLFLMLWIVFGWLFGLHRISGIGMDPGLRDGELALFARVGNEYAVGDVVLFERDGSMQASRIFATGGQLIDANDDGYLTIDGAIQSDGIVVDMTEDNAKERIGLPFRVPSGAYYLLNDNYEFEEDSRSFGALYEKDFRGKVISTLKVRNI